jgi:hypothetical protein
VPGSIDVRLDAVRLVDPALYTLLLAQGALSVTGPLAVAPRVAGRIDLGESELRVPETGLGSAPPSRRSPMSAKARRTPDARGGGAAAATKRIRRVRRRGSRPADQRTGAHLPARARHRRGIRRCDPHRGQRPPP